MLPSQSVQEVDPQQLTCLAGATALRRLVVSRLGNRHANGCFDGCDCNGSPSSSVTPSLASSAASSPDRSEAAAGVGGASLVPAAAAAAAAERRAAVAAASRAASAALAAAASIVAEAAVAAAVGEDAGAEAQLREGFAGGVSASSAAYSDSSSGGGGEAFDACRAVRRRSRPQRSDSSLQHASSWAVETQAEADAAVAAAAAADATMDALARQMAAVGISCRCGRRGCGAAMGADSANASSSAGAANTSGVIAAACAAAAAAARAAAAEAELAATSAAAAAAADTHLRHAKDDVGACDPQCTGAAASGPGAVDAVAHIDGGGGGAAAAIPDDAGLKRALSKVPPVQAPRPFLNLTSDGPSPATGAVLAEAGLPPLAVPLTPRPGLDGALGHLTSLTALTEIQLEGECVVWGTGQLGVGGAVCRR